MMAREDVLIFQCGGSGMAASASTYTDFYYSAGDLLYAPLENTYGDELTEVEPGIYEWSNDSCLLHIEKITDGWYYLYEEFL